MSVADNENISEFALNSLLGMQEGTVLRPTEPLSKRLLVENSIISRTPLSVLPQGFVSSPPSSTVTPSCTKLKDRGRLGIEQKTPRSDMTPSTPLPTMVRGDSGCPGPTSPLTPASAFTPRSSSSLSSAASLLSSLSSSSSRSGVSRAQANLFDDIEPFVVYESDEERSGSSLDTDGKKEKKVTFETRSKSSSNHQSPLSCSVEIDNAIDEAFESFWAAHDTNPAQYVEENEDDNTSHLITSLLDDMSAAAEDTDLSSLDLSGEELKSNEKAAEVEDVVFCPRVSDTSRQGSGQVGPTTKHVRRYLFASFCLVCMYVFSVYLKQFIGNSSAESIRPSIVEGRGVVPSPLPWTKKTHAIDESSTSARLCSADETWDTVLSSHEEGDTLPEAEVLQKPDIAFNDRAVAHTGMRVTLGTTRPPSLYSIRRFFGPPRLPIHPNEEASEWNLSLQSKAQLILRERMAVVMSSLKRISKIPITIAQFVLHIIQSIVQRKNTVYSK